MTKMGPIELGRVTWFVRQLNHRLGWQGLLGCFLVAGSLAALPLVITMMAESHSIRDDAQLLRESVATRTDVLQRDDPAAQLQELYKSFPGSDFLANSLQKIYAAAMENNIVLTQGDYSLIEAEANLIQRYEVSIPVRAKYSQVRGFLSHVLREKNIALLNMSLVRNTPTDSAIDAQLRFAVYVKDAP